MCKLANKSSCRWKENAREESKGYGINQKCSALFYSFTFYFHLNRWKVLPLTHASENCSVCVLCTLNRACVTTEAYGNLVSHWILYTSKHYSIRRKSDVDVLKCRPVRHQVVGGFSFVRRLFDFKEYSSIRTVEIAGTNAAMHFLEEKKNDELTRHIFFINFLDKFQLV